MPEQSWEEFVQEFEEIERNPDYKPFRSILEHTRSIIGVANAHRRQRDMDGARGLFNFVQVLKSKYEAGEDVTPILDNTAAGNIQPDWLVKGDVKQANRDFIDNSKQYVMQIVLANSSELNFAAQSPRILVPIVPVVMTQAQADELIQKTIFKSEPQVLENGFDELYQFLQGEASDWIHRYGARPQDWKPFGSGPADLTLEQLIINALTGLEEEFKDVDCPLTASFSDVIALSQGEGRSKLRRIRESGCIVILDVISIRHPKLQRAFQQTLLDAYPRTSVVSIAPSEKSYKLATSLAVLVQLKVEEMEFQRRRADPGDWGASEKIFEEQAFKPWLSTRLKNIDLSKRRGGAPRVV